MNDGLGRFGGADCLPEKTEALFARSADPPKQEPETPARFSPGRPAIPPVSPRSVAQFERWNPMRRPDWRWQAALKLVIDNRRPVVGEDRQFIRALRHFAVSINA